jgi:uncharacterized protein YjbI with pentapeptide repeats
MADEKLVMLLRQGAAQWNAWRKGQGRSAIDLSEVDLIGANLSEADLSAANLRAANLRG